jgi:hypothetical protein
MAKELKEIYGILTRALDRCYELQFEGELEPKDYEFIREKLSDACSAVYVANKWPGMLSSYKKEKDQ